LRRESWTLPTQFQAGDTEIVPLGGGESVGWRMA
jgi:dihydroorotase